MKPIYFIDIETYNKLEAIIKTFEEYKKCYNDTAMQCYITEKMYNDERIVKNDYIKGIQANIAHANGRYYEGMKEAFDLCAFTLKTFIELYKG